MVTNRKFAAGSCPNQVVNYRQLFIPLNQEIDWHPFLNDEPVCCHGPVCRTLREHTQHSPQPVMWRLGLVWLPFELRSSNHMQSQSFVHKTQFKCLGIWFIRVLSLCESAGGNVWCTCIGWNSKLQDHPQSVCVRAVACAYNTHVACSQTANHFWILNVTWSTYTGQLSEA